MKKIKHMFAPLGEGRIRLMFRYYNNKKAFAFEGELKSKSKIAKIEEILHHYHKRNESEETKGG